MNIPEEAIEAAEQIIWQRTDGGGYQTARLTLEAAAPMIVAQALRDEADRLAELANIHAATNLWFVVDAIRARADKLEAHK